jgi:hypothetical protein
MTHQIIMVVHWEYRDIQVLGEPKSFGSHCSYGLCPRNGHYCFAGPRIWEVLELLIFATKLIHNYQTSKYT